MSTTGSILSNIGAMQALNSLSQTTNAMAYSENELSSGLATNSPADNPAGSIEATGFSSQIGGEDQASSNISSTISLMQTAQGGVTQQVNIAQKLYSLAVEAANGTQTSSERSSLQSVAENLLGEMNKISSSTQFNNINLLDGSLNGMQIQTGANEGQKSLFTIPSTSISKIGLKTSSSLGSYKSTNIGKSSGTLQFKNAAGQTGSITITSGTSAKTVAQEINALGLGATATAKTSVAFTMTTAASHVVESSGGKNTNLHFADTFASTTTDYSTLNAQLASLHMTIGQNASSAAKSSYYKISQASGGNIEIFGKTSPARMTTSTGAHPALSGTIFKGSLQITGSKGLQITNSSLLNLTKNPTSLTVPKFKSLADINLSTASGAESAISIIQASISSLSNIGGQIGAAQDGLVAENNYLSTNISNETTALGVVQDANIPQVTNNLTEEQISAQSGIAALKASTQLQQSYTSLLP